MDERERIALYTTLFESRRKDIAHFLWKKYGRVLYADIEDVMQDVYLKGLRNFKPEKAAAFKTWIILCAISAANDRCRRLKRRKRVAAAIAAEPEPEQHLLTEFISPERMLEARENRGSLQRLLDRLPAHFREVLALRIFEDLSYEELAARLGISVRAMTKRLYLARRRAFELLASETSVA